MKIEIKNAIMKMLSDDATYGNPVSLRSTQSFAEQNI